LRAAGRKVRQPARTVATVDHNIPTEPRGTPITDLIAAKQIAALQANCKEFGVLLFDMDSPEQGIVHVIGPELGLTRPGMTIVCGDSHTSTHGAFGALAFGIGTSEVEHVLATQCLAQQRPKRMKIEVRGRLAEGVAAKDLALVLRAGALPASIKYLEERTVGPSLGADSIRSGVRASLASLIVVMLFLVVYYRLSGVNAVVALILNLLILIAFMALVGAVLTLPGIAGVVLTIGMGVDSNVLVFERIREEIRNGKTPSSAVENGFNNAFRTIIDTHVTTLVSAAFLLLFGTGPVQGFAITLIIGLLANVFTSIFVSRTIFDWHLSRMDRQEPLSI